MTINIWYSPQENTYNIRYNGKRYKRKSYLAAKELIESLVANMVLVESQAA